MYVLEKDVENAITGLNEIIHDDQIRPENKVNAKTWLQVYKNKQDEIRKRKRASR